MRNYIFVITYITVSLFFHSCIKDEALNAEADIVECQFPQGVVPDAINYYAPFDEELNAYPLKIVIPNGWDLNTLVIVYKVTHGASLSWEGTGPNNEVNYNLPVVFTVTSQDGKWQKRYVVMVSHPDKRTIPDIFRFEECKAVPYGDTKYAQFFETVEGDKMDIWDSGNVGFALTGGGKSLDSYPTFQSLEGEGLNGSRCATLVTRSTGAFGAMAKKPMAAGNLFLGSFDVTYAMQDALLTTHFGIVTYQKPLRVHGWYKYTPGDVFMENHDGNLMANPDRTDACTITGVFFKTDDNLKFLDGHHAADQYVDSHVVAHGLFRSDEVVSEWREFEFDLDYAKCGDQLISEKDLKNGIYKMALVFSSSEFGDNYTGAFGSTLMVDDVEVVFDVNE